MAGLTEYLTRIEYMWRYTCTGRWTDTCLRDKEFELCISFNLSYDMDILSYDQKYITYAW